MMMMHRMRPTSMAIAETMMLMNMKTFPMRRRMEMTSMLLFTILITLMTMMRMFHCWPSQVRKRMPECLPFT